MVDGGGGNTVLSQLKHAGFDWMDMREMFVTHKHVDHIMGIIWMIRMICQYMNQGDYEGEANIYAHDEVTGILRSAANRLLQKKETRFIDKRLHYKFTLASHYGKFYHISLMYTKILVWLIYQPSCKILT